MKPTLQRLQVVLFKFGNLAHVIYAHMIYACMIYAHMIYAIMWYECFAYLSWLEIIHCVNQAFSLFIYFLSDINFMDVLCFA